jgi:hypothetical protein
VQLLDELRRVGISVLEIPNGMVIPPHFVPASTSRHSGRCPRNRGSNLVGSRRIQRNVFAIRHRPDRANGLFYNDRYRPGTAGAQSSTSGVPAEILGLAGLKQIGMKALQLPFWRARSLFDSTGRLDDAAGVLGCSAIKVPTRCGIDIDALSGVVSL